MCKWNKVLCKQFTFLWNQIGFGEALKLRPVTENIRNMSQRE